MIMFGIGSLLAFAAGVSFVFQQAVNSNLRLEIGSTWWAGFASYLGGTIAMLGVALTLREPFPSVAMVSRSHAMSWMGGLFGLPMHHITAPRALGAVLLLAGAILVR